MLIYNLTETKHNYNVIFKVKISRINFQIISFY